ncbi:MAG: Lrp/AsnC family transcriptional regulator [Erysipelotrichaceae bacterium]|nr:Lrp/AsnC family transcriptional regulator [Erysipelotrichaceae bacterium]
MKELLELLEKNGRSSVRDLADLLNESDDVLSRQISEYEKNGIIAGYHTIINWDKADTEITRAIIFVNYMPEREAGYDKVASRLAHYPEVETLYLLSGKAEFMLEVRGKTMRDISDFVAHKLAPTEGINGTETMFILKQYKKDGISFSDEAEDGERLIVTP